MKITEVTLFKVSGHYTGPTYPPGDRQAKSLDIYPEYNAQSATQVVAGRELSACYVEITTDEGVSGLFGPVDEYQTYLIAEFLTPFLLGRDPLATEALHDQMLRLHRHGRSGLFVAAVSPVDCALWDLKGKAWRQPVYRLLGGPTRPAVPAYASMLGFPIEPDAAATIAQEYRAQGFAAQKWFFRHGPADGETGKEKNVALVRALRQVLGPHYTLMFDAFMGWDVPYASEMMRALAPYNLTWLEEPIPPERVGSFRRLKQVASVPIATGEHVITRWQVKELLVAGALDVVQTDPDWTGGITELAKICALASAFDTPVIAHGHSLLAALHVAGAQPSTTVPMVEYLVQVQPRHQYFQRHIYRPEHGMVKLPQLPGLGIVLDDEKIDAREILAF